MAVGSSDEDKQMDLGSSSTLSEQSDNDWQQREDRWKFLREKNEKAKYKLAKVKSATKAAKIGKEAGEILTVAAQG